VHKFLIHNEGDDVGVATEDIGSGEEVVGVYMDSGGTVTVTSHGDIPLGHKIALGDLAEGQDVIEYGVRVGRTRQAVRAGDYIHTHNIRSARWATS